VNQSGANRLTANKNTNKERTNRMINMLNESTRRPRLTKTTFLSILAITGVVITAAFFRADAGANAPTASVAAINVKVEDENGRPIPGLAVHLYEGATGKCQCLNGQCDIAPDATATTDNRGRASFRHLMNNTVYTVCTSAFGEIEQCSGPSPCVDPSQCSFSGMCRTVTTRPGITTVGFGGP